MSGLFSLRLLVFFLAFLAAYFVTVAVRKNRQRNISAVMEDKPASNEALKITAACILGALAVGIMGGWLLHDSAEFHNTFVLTNAVVEGQNGVYVTFHFESDATKRQRTLKFCEDYIPDFQPGQVIDEMVYTRKAGCESIAGKRFSLTLRRVNGVPILKEQ